MITPPRPGGDEELAERRTTATRAGYARAEIPYRLLVDRNPKAPPITLHSIPDHGARAYLHKDTWKFGETVALEHFGVEIDTAGRRPWNG